MPKQPRTNEDPVKQTDQHTDQPHANELNEPIPHVGQPLDGRHYLDVLEEQTHADTRPQPDGENPRHPETGAEHQ
ncbi:hypothetical protein Q8A64_02740 [Oxalobacteraceae bacterium R-40]|uniref:Uncharacterized protein n=1 Tax=Keguizhuia sedimenti TaxID=3064264 RepID=A0ABU1BK09_9BURK|nr:hypothetical protein [Oxalobacteraceae bacterium R-40]